MDRLRDEYMMHKMITPPDLGIDWSNSQSAVGFAESTSCTGDDDYLIFELKLCIDKCQTPVSDGVLRFELEREMSNDEATWLGMHRPVPDPIDPRQSIPVSLETVPVRSSSPRGYWFAGSCPFSPKRRARGKLAAGDDASFLHYGALDP